MKNKRTGLHSTFPIIGLFVAAVLRFNTVASATPQMDSIEEIVVTARKTQESLQSVPLSISAVTGAELQKRSLESLAALGQFTPNFSFTEQAQAGRTAGVIYIRGIGQGETLSTFDPAVGVYLDGVYMGRMQGLDLDTMDLERVEILRGPQGTLFGKNTDGGAVSIVTRPPNPSADGLGGKLQVIGGSFARADVVAGLNVPVITDKLAVNISLARRKQDGYGHRIDGQDMADKNRYLGRLGVLYKPVDRLSLLFNVDALTSKERQSSYKLLKVGPQFSVPIPALGGHPFNDFLSQPYDNRWLTNNDFTWNATGPNSARSDLWGTSLTATLDADWATLKSITSYRRTLVHNDLDPDGSPVTIVNEFQTIKQHQVSQEFQATGLSFNNRLKWVLGLYYFDESAHDATDFPVLTDFGDAFSFSQVLDVKNKSYAVYGQGVYGLTDKLSLTVGARYNYEDKSALRLKLQYPSGVSFDASTDNAPTEKDGVWHSVSPRFGLDYRWVPGLMTYVSIADGFKSGGFNGRAGTVTEFNRFEPEKVRTYEVGLRSDWLENRVRVNATVFYSNYKDLQIQINKAGVGSQGQPVPLQFVGNVPRATIKGAELEFIAVPISGLTINASIGLTDAKYKELLPGAPVTLQTPFINTPKTSAAAGLEYSTSRSANVTFTGRLDYAYKSSISYDVPNPSNLITQKGYGLLNSKLILDLNNSHLSFALFATNLTDKHYFVGGWDTCTASSLAFCIVEYAPPREWGISAEYRF